MAPGDKVGSNPAREVRVRWFWVGSLWGRERALFEESGGEHSSKRSKHCAPMGSNIICIFVMLFVLQIVSIGFDRRGLPPSFYPSPSMVEH